MKSNSLKYKEEHTWKSPLQQIAVVSIMKMTLIIRIDNLVDIRDVIDSQ